MTKDEFDAIMLKETGSAGLPVILENGSMGLINHSGPDSVMIDTYTGDKLQVIFVPYANLIKTHIGVIVGLKGAKIAGQATELPIPPEAPPLSDLERQELAALRREHGGWCFKRAEPGTYSIGQHFVLNCIDTMRDGATERTERQLFLRVLCGSTDEAHQLTAALMNGQVEFRGLELRCSPPRFSHNRDRVEVEFEGQCVYGEGLDGYKGNQQGPIS